ncbi:probable leucyl/phenylalanyl-tRNA--protein transferase [Psychrobacter arcticus 273-4]|uniref:Leucyl/phenylalanyl-tRNA--protein transferase n=1 Tax=Psychrobacter arcticus (strain DSM 17307 / VKM B-2377 / 273-4) TaxID=259536 RepID=LFTR_PSYA2|nr:leucyl/phenylalanyl-tRNA--protein transferase [Psychrobacter arcticus]Q4FUQ3.1 RecName: Full=Leucyl/phenylalanyl-tRNA--protein transferase; AltName: Full=L/F-transferase; AltName: Full=Leucyltransferase; AltName: Full=Phenyalanyltransferase [Psychrobacter arcticus 273-4]AAZ18255.1 probable leucyl/phenylalanyl-tRNA--protein transferase [Psychrobacter arcticus 273-4]
MNNINDSSAIHITPETFVKQIRSLGRYNFPEPALVDPDGIGIVGIGGNLAPETLISAYAQGLFPWFNDDEPIAWWCPEPRCVMQPTDYQPSKSLRKQANNARWQLTLNQAFNEVIHACSLPRSNGLPEGEHTWIHDDMIEAYNELHAQGFAHSVEVWDDQGQLVGGLYGLKIGSIYFGESMFHIASNASKLAFWGLMRLCTQSNVTLVDCQLPNEHLMSLGAITLSRTEFLTQLDTLISNGSDAWHKNSHRPLAVSLLGNLQPWQLNP